MKEIKNKFVAFLIVLTMISGFAWMIKYYAVDCALSEGARADEIAKLFMEKGVFNDDPELNHNIDRTMYPMILSWLYGVFGHYFIVIRLFQLLLFVLLVLSVYKLCRLVFDETTARIAGTMTALCYTLAVYVNWIYREFFLSFLLVILVYCLYKAQFTNKKRWFALSGIMCGISLLTSAILGFFVFVILGYFVILNWKKGFRNIFPRLVTFVFFLVLIVTPMVVHFYVTFDRFMFTAGSGLVLPQRVERMYIVNEKYLEHIVGNTFGDFFAYKLFEDYDPSESRLGWESYQRWQDMIYEEKIERSEVDKILTNEAIGEIFRHPILYSKLVVIDLLKYNTPMLPAVRMQHMFVDSHDWLPDSIKGLIILAIRLFYFSIFLVIVYGLIRGIRQWRKMGWIFLVVFYLNFVFSNLIAIARHSVPVYPQYIILFGVGASLIWKKFHECKK